LAAATTAFAAIHRQDPAASGDHIPAVGYHEAVARWVDALDPTAALPVRLAARCQHLRRWAIPRADFPAGNNGYKQWRSTLARQHAQEAGEVLAAVGYEPEVVSRVRDLLIKKHLRSDPEVRLLEDAVCLTFLELQFVDFAGKHPEEKVVDIVRKTLDKMSPAGRVEAVALMEHLAASGAPSEAIALVRRAVES
jgi:hypothetical protein